jgi:hypothetical protein
MSNGSGMALFKAHQRKALTSVTLGCWLFALFVGVVHACGLDGELVPLQQAAAVSTNAHDQCGSDAPPGCERFCTGDLPLLAKIQSVQDQPGGHAILAPMFGEPLWPRVVAVPSPLFRTRPAPGIYLIARSVRLAL